MFEFFGNTFYLLLLGIILLITHIVVRNAFSKKIIAKQPNALIWNNSLIILEVALVLATFFIFSWIAGITTLVFAFIVYVLFVRKVGKEIEANLLDISRKESEE